MSGVPHELIREVQISTRSASGLSNYNPSDPNLPALPPLSAVIADSATSSPHLRCKNCNGRLLRGPESIICVYCGCGPHYDVVPDPIGFTSTIGYQWLLRSLRLDGSETVDRPNKNEQDQSHSSPKALPLSDLLNFMVPWPAETEKEETSSPEASKRSYSLTGVAPDKFFIKSKTNVLSESSLEQPVLHNVIERRDVDNQDLFQNIQSSEPAVSSSKQKTADAFSGWQADFQFPDSENQQAGQQSSEHVAGSSVEPGSKFQDSETFEDFQFTNSENQHGGRKSSEHFVSSSVEPGNEFQDSETFEDFQFADSENQLGARKSSEHFVSSSVEPGNEFQHSETFEDFQFANSENQLGGRKSSEHFVSSSVEPGNEFQDSEAFEDFQFADSEKQHGGRKSSENVVVSSAESGIKLQDSECFEDFQFADSENQQGARKSSEHVVDSSADPKNKFQDSELFDDFQFADYENQRDVCKPSEHIDGTSAEPGNKFQDSALFEDFQFANSENQQGGSKSSEPGNNFEDSELFEDFQFANPENQHGGRKSSEHFVGSSAEPGNKFQDSDHSSGLEVDLSAHIDSVFGPGKDLNEGKPKDNPAFNNWDSDDLWNNLTSNKADSVSTKHESKSDHTLEYPKNDLSTGGDLFVDFQSQSNYPNKPENKAVNEEHKIEDEDSFEEWNDFTGSTSLNQASTPEQKLSGIDLFNSDNKFEGVAQPDLFSTSTSSKSTALPETNTTMSENPASNWLSDASQESGQAAKTEDSSGKSNKDDDVKKLISEMHDLSFMLKTELSLPRASDTPTLPPKN